MVTNDQLKLIHLAARRAGLIDASGDRRYRLLLAQYKTPGARPVRSSKELNNFQIEDFLAICESLGFDSGKGPTHYRDLVAGRGNLSGFAQRSAIDYLRGDLGWTPEQLKGMVRRMTHDRTDSLFSTTVREASNLIEALKNMLSRQRGVSYTNLSSITQDTEVAHAEKDQSCKI
jgi:hypothetical protein